MPYLNGGLFLHHKLELDEQHQPRLGTTLRIPDAAFEGVFEVFAAFTWHLDDTPGGDDDEINPDVLGYIFEKYINQKAFGAYYTRPEITGYLAERSIHRLILERVHAARACPSCGLPEIEVRHSVPTCWRAWTHAPRSSWSNEVLPVHHPARPGRAVPARFWWRRSKCLINVYSAVVGRAESGRQQRPASLAEAHPDRTTPASATTSSAASSPTTCTAWTSWKRPREIAKLRLFLAMVSSVRKVDELEPLPNIDFNILPGNSLVGLMRVDEHEFDAQEQQGDLFRKSYRELLDEKNRGSTPTATPPTMGQSVNLRELRDDIDDAMAEANAVMNEMLLDQFEQLGIKYEQATWDATKGDLRQAEEAQASKLADIDALHPFHWGFVFDEIVQQRGGFDII